MFAVSRKTQIRHKRWLLPSRTTLRASWIISTWFLRPALWLTSSDGQWEHVDWLEIAEHWYADEHEDDEDEDEEADA